MREINVSKAMFKLFKKKTPPQYEEIPVSSAAEDILLKTKVTAAVEARLVGFGKMGTWTWASIGFYSMHFLCTLCLWLFVYHCAFPGIWLISLFVTLIYTVAVMGYIHILSGLCCVPNDIKIYGIYRLTETMSANAVVRPAMQMTRACLTKFMGTSELCDCDDTLLPVVLKVDTLMAQDLMDFTDDIYIVFHSRGYGLGSMGHLFLKSTPDTNKVLSDDAAVNANPTV